MKKLKIASWNINSVRLRIEQVGRFAKEQQPDIIALQEIKCLNEEFPRNAFVNYGYPYIEVSGQKGLHGAATVSKIPLIRLDTQFCPRGEARHVSTIIEGGLHKIELHNFYIPAGGDEPDSKVNPKFAHKLEFVDILTDYFGGRSKRDDGLVLAGDFNIAPHPNDVWSHKQLLKIVSHTPIEVEKLTEFLNSHDFTDCGRALTPIGKKLYSWWSYRSRDINTSDRGRRLDHIWVSPVLKDAALGNGADSHQIHRSCRFWEKPSDHAPVTQVLDFSLFTAARTGVQYR